MVRATKKKTVSDYIQVLLPSLLAALMMVGGWLVNQGATQATLRDHEKRISNIETRFDKDVVPRQEVESKDRELHALLSQMQQQLTQIQQELLNQRAGRR